MSNPSKPRTQSGIRRTWLKSALKTTAANRLTPEQRAVLTWFVSAEAEDDDWFALFSQEASKELNKPKKTKKSSNTEKE